MKIIFLGDIFKEILKIKYLDYVIISIIAKSFLESFRKDQSMDF